jgi:uncharacterized protein (DUF362 family)
VSTVYLQKGGDREAFVRKVFQQFEVQRRVAGKKVLVKPNIVSHEPYPTTTHPAMVESCLELLQGFAEKIIVADGPAFDARDPGYLVEEHVLKESCDKFGVELLDLLSKGTRKVKTRSLELEMSLMAFECDFIISLPVLKTHSICGLTGALKNQLGFLSLEEKGRLHSGGDVHRVIAELNEVVKPDLHIVDAVQTMVVTNEARHGGRPVELGYMLAGTDPVSLDAVGLELLAKVEPKLKGKRINDILHLKHAIEISGWDARYGLVEW